MGGTISTGFAGAALGIGALMVLGFRHQDEREDLGKKLDELKALTIVANHRAAFRHGLSEDCDLAVTLGVINLRTSVCGRYEGWLKAEEFLASERKSLESGAKPNELTIAAFLGAHVRHLTKSQPEDFRRLSDAHAKLLDELRKKQK